MSLPGLNSHSLIFHTPTSVRFGFYTSEEILKLSSVKITSELAIDGTGQVVSGGLHDLRMGAISTKFDRNARCHTCGMNEFKCEGHMGHIELSVPLYHPLLFNYLYKLMRAKCAFCHHLRIHRVKVWKSIYRFFASLIRSDCLLAGKQAKAYITKLKLAAAGLSMLFSEVDEIISSVSAQSSKPKKRSASKAPAKKRSVSETSKKSSKQKAVAQSESDSNSDSDSDEVHNVRSNQQQLKLVADRSDDVYRISDSESAADESSDATDSESAAPSKSSSITERRLDEMIAIADKALLERQRDGTLAVSSSDHAQHRAVLRQFFSEFSSRKCPNCSCVSPSLRKDGYSKIFRRPLSAADAARNSSQPQALVMDSLTTRSYLLADTHFLMFSQNSLNIHRRS